MSGSSQDQHHECHSCTFQAWDESVLYWDLFLLLLGTGRLEQSLCSQGRVSPLGSGTSMALEMNSRNKCLLFLLRGTHRGLRSVLPWEGLGGAARLPSQFSNVAVTFCASVPRAVAGCAVPDPGPPSGGSAMMGSGVTGAAALDEEELSPVWLSHHSPASSPGPPRRSRLWVGKRCFLCIC